MEFSLRMKNQKPTIKHSDPIWIKIGLGNSMLFEFYIKRNVFFFRIIET